MRELLTADDLFSHLLILRGVSNKRFILVEGDDDYGMLDPHLDDEVCETIPTGGKSVVLEAAEIAERQSLTGIGIVLDLDWAGLLYPKICRPNVFYTDFYDIDATAFSVRQAVIGLITNNIKREKLRAAARGGAAELLDRAIEIAKYVGFLRFLSESNRWELNVRDFPVHLAMREDFSVDPRRMVDVALSRSKRARVQAGEVLREVGSLVSEAEDPYRYCSGHDLLSATAAIIRKVGEQVSSKSVGAALRASFSCQDVAKSRLFCDISAWGRSLGSEFLTCA
ncbi:hypothetical protein ACF06T_21795 [Streptomyces albidoflavus]